MDCQSCKDKELAPANDKGTVYLRCGSCERPLCETKTQRSGQQNKALHKFAEELANELNDRGLDMKQVLKPEVEIPWDKETVKRYLIHPIIKAKYQKESTADLSTKELSEGIDILNRHLLQKFDIDMPFPSSEADNFIEEYG